MCILCVSQNSFLRTTFSCLTSVLKHYVLIGVFFSVPLDMWAIEWAIIGFMYYWVTTICTSEALTEPEGEPEG